MKKKNETHGNYEKLSKTKKIRTLVNVKDDIVQWQCEKTWENDFFIQQVEVFTLGWTQSSNFIY